MEGLPSANSATVSGPSLSSLSEIDHDWLCTVLFCSDFVISQSCAESSTQLRALYSFDRVAKRLVTDLGLARSRMRLAKPHVRGSTTAHDYTKAALEFHAAQSARYMAKLSGSANIAL
jgi:hypothetical protein